MKIIYPLASFNVMRIVWRRRIRRKGGVSSPFSDSDRLGGGESCLTTLTYGLTGRCSTRLSYAGASYFLRGCVIYVFGLEYGSRQFFRQIRLYDVVQPVSGECFKFTFPLLFQEMFYLWTPRFLLTSWVLHHVLQALHVDV